MTFSKNVVIIIALVLLGTLIFSPAVLAQEPTPAPTGPTLTLPNALPTTAQEGLSQAAALLIALGGIVAGQVTDSIKTIKWLKPKEQEQITGLAAFLITGVFSLIAGVAGDRGMEYAAGIDTSGLWQLILTVGPWVVAEIRYRVKTLYAA